MTFDSLEQFMRHTMSMKYLTSVELVNTYWQQAHQIANTGRLGFIIRGNMSWESKQQDGIFSNGLWLKTNKFDPIGKHIATNSLRTYLQWYMNLYEIWGTLKIDIDLNDAQVSKPLIEHAIEKIASVTNTMSILFGVSLRWIPATYGIVSHMPLPSAPESKEYDSWDCVPLQISQDEHITTILTDEAILHELIPLLRTLESLPTNIRPIILTALDWHASANRFLSGLNRFLNYWSSIELLGNYFYKRLQADIVHRNTRRQKRDKILTVMKKGVTIDNCMTLIEDCNEIRNPSARTRILSFLGIIANRERMYKALFESDEKSGKSLYHIRNEIAHGSISERDFEIVESMRHRLFDARNISREIIIETINKAESLEKYMI
jgi:hypothetical protein